MGKNCKNQDEGYNIEQRNKFLEDIGLKPHQYGVNFIMGKDKREKEWRRERKSYGFDNRETWNLNSQFVEWLYSHLKMYLDKADEIINLEYYTFEFEDQEFTQRAAIEYIMDACVMYLTNRYAFNDKEEESIKEMQKAIQLWGLIFPTMWW